MRGWLRLATVGLCIPLLTVGYLAKGQNLRTNRFSTGWIIGEPIRGSKLPKGTVAESRLLPETLATIDADAILASSREIAVAKGDKLHAIYLEGPYIFCVSTTKSKPLTWLWGALQQQYSCLIDLDMDGVFEEHYKAASSIDGVPAIKEAPPKTGGAPIEPLAYRTIDREAFTRTLILRAHCADKKKVAQVSFSVQGDGKAVLVEGTAFEKLGSNFARKPDAPDNARDCATLDFEPGIQRERVALYPSLRM